MNPTKANAAKAFEAALSLEPGKQIVITQHDRKAFLSIKAQLYEIRRKFGNIDIKISTIGNTIILREKTDEEKGVGLNLSYREQLILDDEQIAEEEFNSLPLLGRKPKKSTEVMQKLSSLISKKESIQSEIKDIISIIGQDQATIDMLDSKSELFKLNTKSFQSQKEIRDFRKLHDIKQDFSTTEPENELLLIEPD